MIECLYTVLAVSFYSRRRTSWLLGGQSGLKMTWDWLLKIDLWRETLIYYRGLVAGTACSAPGVLSWENQ
jgi:hypothetical protein